MHRSISRKDELESRLRMDYLCICTLRRVPKPSSLGHPHLDESSKRPGLTLYHQRQVTSLGMHLISRDKMLEVVGLLSLSPDLQCNTVAHGTAGSSHLTPKVSPTALQSHTISLAVVFPIMSIS